MRNILLFEKSQSNKWSAPVDMTPVPDRTIKSAKSAASNVTNVSNGSLGLEPLNTGDGTYVDVGRLIVAGVVGAAGGILLSHFSLTTCDFVKIEIPVGYYNETLTAHAGMNKFSLLDSIFYGSGYGCVSYDDPYYGKDEAPQFAKIMSANGMGSGCIATLIIWLFNFTSSTTASLWNIGRLLAGLAALTQFASLQIFFSPLCEEQGCSPGPGTFCSCFAAFIFAFMAFEMTRNDPVQSTTDKLGDGKEVDSAYSAPDLV